MHGISPQQFAESASAFLVPFYLALAVMNGIAALYLWQKTEPVTYFGVTVGGTRATFTNAFLWALVAGVYVILAAMCGTNLDYMPQMPEVIKNLINQSTGPVVYSVGATLMLVVLYLGRSFFVIPVVAWSIWNLMLLFLALSLPDPNFFAIVAKPDNVPIVAIVFLLAFFTWLATHRAVENDKRAAAGEPPLEKLDNEKVLVWPDLVYTELICMIALSALLIFWAIWLQAPLEEPASSVKTPNPSKAPWYFLGLQEMLVYYDPWMAGVVLPSLIVAGLMAIPYIDFNKLGNGYYTINQRKFAYLTFQFGFLDLWITLIILGTLLRGPNWNFFGPYEFWDAHKVEALNNINLSEMFWQTWASRSLPKPGADATWYASWGTIILREWMGIVLVLGYFIALPPLMAVTVFRKFYQHMGFIRYMVMTNLLLFMMALPIKMVLRWTFNLKYIIAIPEYFINF
jgi:hypothetical protein